MTHVLNSAAITPITGLPTMPTREESAAAAIRLGSPDAHVARVLEIAGARALALDTFLRLSRVEWSAEVATACIECADRPRLLLNPAFVEARCTTPERLATLLLHELAHVSMGHTRLFPRPTVSHNIACDAIINRELAGLAAECGLGVIALTALLVECYPADAAPWFLLRPPPGWPVAPQWDASIEAPASLRAIHRRLYDTALPEDRHGVQYGEIVAALQKSGVARSLPREGDVTDSEILARLLGGHGTTAQERAALTGGRDAVGADALGAALQRITGRVAGAGGDAAMMQLQRGVRHGALTHALEQLVRRCYVQQDDRVQCEAAELPGRGAFPDRDRRAPARTALAKAFGAPRPLLFDTVRVVQRRVPRGVTIYLDVSGSMSGVLPALHAALVPLRRVVRPRILLFSTLVVEAGGEDFDAGRLCTTGGTDITPVLEHLLQQPPRRNVANTNNSDTDAALVLTDGYFDHPPAAIRSALCTRGLRVHLGIVDNGPLHDTAPWVASATRLPTR